MIENQKIKFDDSKKVNLELEAIKYKNQIITTENSFIQKQLSILREKFKTPSEIENSFEKILQEEYAKMKDSLVNKINSLTDEYSSYQINASKKIAILEEELKIYKKTRELYVNQMIEARKKLQSI